MKQPDNGLPADQVLPLLRQLPAWGPTTTIVQHGGCVFEFKGAFPPGEVGEGYYNLDGGLPGFHGHLRLDAIAGVGFQERQHRGRSSYAFTFDDSEGNTLFKVFLGRDSAGELLPAQVAHFCATRDNRRVIPFNPQELA